jgi:hypothetical protein
MEERQNKKKKNKKKLQSNPKKNEGNTDSSGVTSHNWVTAVLG